MADKEVKLGFVGCGGIGMGHLSVWKDIPGVKITAVCDIIPERAQKASENYGGDPYTDMAEMLAKADIDAVDICTFSGLHAQQGLMAIEAGKHVIVEKPLDIDIKKVDKLIEAADKSGLVLACIFQNRISPQMLQAKKLIDEGKLGRLISGSTFIKWWRGQDYYDSDAWRGTWALDGGCFSNQGVHAIDQLCWICGPVKEVNACHIETAMHKMEAEDYGLAHLTFENGAHGIIEATTCCYPGMGMRTEVFGDKGSAVFEGNRVVSFSVRGEEIELSEEMEGVTDGRADPMAIEFDGHTAQLRDFIKCINEGGEPLVSGRSARLAVDTLTKLYNKAGITKLGT